MPGIEAEFFARVMDVAGISYRMTAAIPKWGRRLPNGTWTGLYDGLLRQQHDTAATFFSMTPQRIENFTFVLPFRCYLFCAYLLPIIIK